MLKRWFTSKKTDSENLSGIEGRLKSRSVLIVDDSKTQLFAMEKMLRSVGINTHTAENGKQGILMARHVKPDLILMDIVMPELNGFQATRHLTRQPDTCHIPIIIVSGSNQQSDKAWGLKLGAKDYIAKPVNKNELITKIDLWLNKFSLENSQSEVAKPVEVTETVETKGVLMHAIQ